MEANDNTLISDYLTGKLEGSELDAFEKRLTEDADFAVRLREQQAHLHMLRAIGRAEQKSRLKSQLKRHQASNRRLWMGGAIFTLAAAILLILALPGVIQQSADEMALKYLDAYPASQARGNSEPANRLYDQAFSLYRAANYESALPLFEQLSQLDGQEAMGMMYKAECLGQLGRHAEAAATYARIPDSVVFYDVVQWKQALNLLLAGETEAARELLEKIQQSPHYRSRQAASLLENL